MKKKVFGILSLSALAMGAISLTGCTISDEDLFEQNKYRVFLENNLNKTGGQGMNGKISGKVRVFTAFTPDFVEKGGKVGSWTIEYDDLKYTETQIDEFTIEPEHYLDISQFTDKSSNTAKVVNPFFGEDTVYLKLSATVTLGTRTHDITWRLVVSPYDIQGIKMKDIFNNFQSYNADGTKNVEEVGFAIKEHSSVDYTELGLNRLEVREAFGDKCAKPGSGSTRYYSIHKDTDISGFASMSENARNSLAVSIVQSTSVFSKYLIRKIDEVSFINELEAIENKDAEVTDEQKAKIKSIYDSYLEEVFETSFTKNKDLLGNVISEEEYNGIPEDITVVKKDADGKDIDLTAEETVQCLKKVMYESYKAINDAKTVNDLINAFENAKSAYKIDVLNGVDLSSDYVALNESGFIDVWNVVAKLLKSLNISNETITSKDEYKFIIEYANTLTE